MVNKSKKENSRTSWHISLAVSILLVSAAASAGASEQLTKVGNSHAVWGNDGQVQLINVDNPVVKNIELGKSELKFRGKITETDSETIIWDSADRTEQKLTVQTAGAMLGWTVTAKALTISIYIPERAFGGTAAWHYSLTDQSGKVVNGRLSSDWNFLEATKHDIAEMQIDTPAGSFTFICEGKGWSFVDTRPSKDHRGSFKFTVTTSQTVSFSVFYGHGRNAKFKTIGISSACNMALKDETSGDQKGGWNDGGTNDLRRLPKGLSHFAGIPFNVIDDEDGTKNACIVLHGKERPYFPLQKTVRLTGKAKMFYFLNALSCGGYGAFERLSKKRAIYTVEYEDGTGAVFDLVTGEHIGEWYEPKIVLPSAVLGWADTMAGSTASKLGLYVTYWENPFPDKELKSITFRTEGISVVGIVGMTVSDHAIYPKVFELKKKDTFPLPTLSVVIAEGPKGSANMMINQHLGAAKVDIRTAKFESLDKNTDVALVCGKLDSEQCDALIKYIRSGGSALFVTETPPQPELEEILPIDANGSRLYDCRNDLSVLIPAEKTHALFSGIPWDNPLERYPISPTYEYYLTTAKPGAEVLAMWNKKAPAVVYWKVGKGHVLVWTCNTTTPGGRQGYMSSHIDYLHAKMMFWLAGHEDIAERFGTLAQAKDTRQSLLDMIAELRIKHENLKATAAYIG
ncbi:MAG: hypothetical protein ABIG61_16865, partial [Planctomycetota bacterium]